jgi:small subunit ribosomal protein S18
MKDLPKDRMDKDPAGMRRTGRRRGCTFCSDDAPPIEYKDPQSLRYFVSERGKIVPRRCRPGGRCQQPPET